MQKGREDSASYTYMCYTRRASILWKEKALVKCSKAFTHKEKKKSKQMVCTTSSINMQMLKQRCHAYALNCSLAKKKKNYISCWAFSIHCSVSFLFLFLCFFSMGIGSVHEKWAMCHARLATLNLLIIYIYIYICCCAMQREVIDEHP